jgi:hypothetical protein
MLEKGGISMYLISIAQRDTIVTDNLSQMHSMPGEIRTEFLKDMSPNCYRLNQIAR